MGKLQGRGIVWGLLIRVLYVSIVAYQDYLQTSQKAEIGFSHTWDWVRMRTIITVQEVEVHGWLLSGSEELFAALFWLL